MSHNQRKSESFIKFHPSFAKNAKFNLVRPNINHLTRTPSLTTLRTITDLRRHPPFFLLPLYSVNIVDHHPEAVAGKRTTLASHWSASKVIFCFLQIKRNQFFQQTDFKNHLKQKNGSNLLSNQIS